MALGIGSMHLTGMQAIEAQVDNAATITAAQ